MIAAGLSPEEVSEVLASDRYADEVRALEQEARRIGVTGVPFFIIDKRLGLSGAQPPEVLVEAIRDALRQRAA